MQFGKAHEGSVALLTRSHTVGDPVDCEHYPTSPTAWSKITKFPWSS